VKAKAVIHLFASGAPSQVDTWDPKPELSKYNDKTIPGHDGLAFGSPFKFNKMGKSGIEVSEVFPKLGTWSMKWRSSVRFGPTSPRTKWRSVSCTPARCSFRNPRWVRGWSMASARKTRICPGSSRSAGQPEWRNAAFLPGIYQGCNVNYSSKMDLDDVILNIKNQFTPPERQRRELDLVHYLNQKHAESLQKDAQLEARIEAFEMAFKMQTEATDAFDISKESKEIKDLYGITPQGGGNSYGMMGAPNTTEVGSKLLVARRLVERGVRFVQVDVGGWDHHANLAVALRNKAGEIDGPAAGLAEGSQATRVAGQHAGDLGRRIRTHGHAGSQRQRARRAATTMAARWWRGWPAAASRAARPTERRTNLAPAPRRTRCISMTSTRRFWR
jgi:hypothetical protein